MKGQCCCCNLSNANNEAEEKGNTFQRQQADAKASHAKLEFEGTLEDIKVEFDIVAFEFEVSELTDRGISLCEAMVMWCEQRNVELELLSAIVKKNVLLKARVEEDARSRNLLKR